MTEKSSDEIMIISNELPVYEQAMRAEIDVQISTAKQYPRDLQKFLRNALFTATINEEVAASCIYVLPRGNDKQIQGVSVHLARILAQNFGNIRVAAKGTQITDKYVIAEAVCMDLETNIAFRVEVRTKILDRYGKRYNEDMINTTMLATISKVERNAILRVIPRGFVDEVYNAALNKLTEPLKEATKLNAARTNAMAWFSKQKIEAKIILEYFDVKTVEDLTADNVAKLRGVRQAITDGDLKPENAFKPDADDAPDGEQAAAKAERFAEDAPVESQTQTQTTPAGPSVPKTTKLGNSAVPPPSNVNYAQKEDGPQGPPVPGRRPPTPGSSSPAQQDAFQGNSERDKRV